MARFEEFGVPLAEREKRRQKRWEAYGRAAYGRWWKISHRHPGWEKLYADLVSEHGQHRAVEEGAITPDPSQKSNRELLLEAARRERNGRRG
jgi:hypothetical protein